MFFTEPISYKLFDRNNIAHCLSCWIVASWILSQNLLLFPLLFFPHTFSLCRFLSYCCQYRYTFFLSQESNSSESLFFSLPPLSLSSSAVLVVRGARPPPPPPSPEEQAERASGQSAHAASLELHEARPLARVSVRTATAAAFDLCEMCVSCARPAL